MNTKAMVWLGFFVGSTIGSYIPTLFGADLFSGWSILGTVIGSILGIWAGYKLGEDWLG